MSLLAHWGDDDESLFAKYERICDEVGEVVRVDNGEVDLTSELYARRKPVEKHQRFAVSDLRLLEALPGSVVRSVESVNVQGNDNSPEGERAQMYAAATAEGSRVGGIMRGPRARRRPEPSCAAR
jgi:hypothetical protein